MEDVDLTRAGAVKATVAPPATVRYFGPGETCTDPALGALILVRHENLAAKVIRFGQWLHLQARHYVMRKPKAAPFWRVNHAATVVYAGDTPLISEQVGRGGVISDLASYAPVPYAVVEVIGATVAEQVNAAAVGYWYAGVPYGWPSIASDATYILTGLPIFLAIGESAVCSAAASLAQRCFGFIPSKADIAEMPSDLAEAFNVVLPLTWPASK